MGGWIGVDLDGTLAHYEGWTGDPHHIGKPIDPMVSLVKQWLAEGREVRIFTARVWEPPGGSDDMYIPDVRRSIQAWCLEHIGVALEVTNVKDYGMIALYDDRAVRIIMNKGVPCCNQGE